MAPFWNCCLRHPPADPLALATPIKVRSVRFEPPDADAGASDAHGASHFRFQESDLDEVNSHYEVPNPEGRQPTQTLPSPPVARATTSGDEVSRDVHPIQRRKVLKKTRGGGGSRDQQQQRQCQEKIETISEKVDPPVPKNDRSLVEGPYSAPYRAGFPNEKDDSPDTEEVKFLRTMVHKLNAELGKMQSRVRSQEGDEAVDASEPPVWARDVRRMAPLVVAFEEEVNEKNEIIQEYEDELRRFKAHFKEMVQRQEKIFSMGPVDPERHLFLKENAEIVLSENDLLKEKLSVLKNCLAYSEDVMNNKVDELQEEIIVHKKKIHDLEHSKKLLEHDNKRLSKEVDKFSKNLRETISMKDHEEVVVNLRTMIKKICESHESNFKEISKDKKVLEGDNEELRRQLARLEITLIQAQCENKVYRKMVTKFEDLTMRLKQQLASALSDGERLRAEALNIKNATQVRTIKSQSLRSSKELKILSRINKRLLDLKTSTAGREEPAFIKGEQMSRQSHQSS